MTRQQSQQVIGRALSAFGVSRERRLVDGLRAASSTRARQNVVAAVPSTHHADVFSQRSACEDPLGADRQKPAPRKKSSFRQPPSITVDVFGCRMAAGGDLFTALPPADARASWLAAKPTPCRHFEKSFSLGRQQATGPNQESSTTEHECSSSSYTNASESRTYCCPLCATSSSPPLPVKAGWRGISPSLDASWDVAGPRSLNKP